MLAPAVSVEHLKDLSQRLVADLAHSLGRELEPVRGAHQVAFLLQALLDAFEVFEVLVGLLSQKLADLIEIQCGQISHASLAPAQKLLQPLELAQDLARLAHPHSLRAMKRILVEKLFQLLHLVQRLA
ncbi:MAG: hypothetical protein HYU47_12230 [Deltaproteobacteria bacterium]|nr:hypothetical protein [Deltaproteobacteria bacterium]